MDALAFGSYCVTFLVGVGTGMAGQYFADKYTDRRREGEAASESLKTFRTLQKKMPDLFAEMKKDLSEEGYSLVREFFVLESDGIINTTSKSLTYKGKDIPDLIEKIKMLESVGFIEDITPRNTPKYRINEEFYELLMKHG